MKFCVRTYGCQMNERDTDAVTALLVARGHSPVADEDGADLILVNTCSVRGKAEDKALGKLRLLAASKRQGRCRVVGAFGCMVQRMGQELFRRVPGLDFAVGTQRLSEVPDIVGRLEAVEGPVLDVGLGREAGALSGHYQPGVSAFVNVLFGCNRGCAYCVVPEVRGSEWSRPGADIVSEAQALAAGGVKEVTLLGQSVMSYGRANAVWPEGDVSPRGFLEPFTRLLEAVAAVPGLGRIRFASGHPSGCTEELAEAWRQLPALCEHLHLPLQSGSDRILERMRRGYTADDYRQAVKRLRAAAPDMAITTDIIVGFPSETIEEFEQTRALMEEIGFDNSFIFQYSPRPRTRAAEWVDDVPTAEKLRRVHVLLVDQDIRGQRLNDPCVGQTVEVLVEGVSLRNEARWAGRTRTNKIVLFDPAEGLNVGAMVGVKIERARPQTLYGAMI
jgi:tRNA-2-methylthio-N6-dimethylallyladenosine synthase